MSENEKTINKLNEWELYYFYYFAPIENINSIVSLGIISKNEVCKNKIKNCSFANKEVQNRRANKYIILNKGQKVNIHDTVPVYLKTKTPTFYSPSIKQDNMVFIVIDAKKLLINDNTAYAFCDGNAASKSTLFYKDLDNLKELPWDVLNNIDHYWDYSDGIRKGNAEFLIHPKIPLSTIEYFVVYNEDVEKILKNEILIPNNILIQVFIDRKFSFFFERLNFNVNNFRFNKTI